MKRPYIPFYTRDWLDDAALRRCSAAARGLLVDLMCLMHEATPYGHLTDERGAQLTEKFILARLMVSARVYHAAIAELVKEERLHYTPSQVLFCKRMVRDEDVRLRRAAGGNLGGNPTFKVNLPGDAEVNLEVNHRGYPRPGNREVNTGPHACASRAETANDTVDSSAFEFTKETSLQKIRDPPADLFATFWNLFRAAGKALNEVDQRAALSLWLSYEPDDHKRIIAWVVHQMKTCWRDEPHTPMPVNALKQQGWTRTPNPRIIPDPTPLAQLSKTDQAFENLRKRGVTFPSGGAQ